MKKIWINTKVLLDSFVELKRRININCDSDTCPIECCRGDEVPVFKNYIPYQQCKFCEQNFFWLYNGKVNLKRDCPCFLNINREILFLRLDECIEELTEKIKKEYS